MKIPLLVAAALGAWYALTPPQPPAGAQERVKSGGVERSFGSVVRIHAFIWKVCLISQTFDVPRLTPPSPVFSHREPSRRARSLYTSRDLLTPPPPIPPHFPPRT
jgi:hypothetical protein